VSRDTSSSISLWGLLAFFTLFFIQYSAIFLGSIQYKISYTHKRLGCRKAYRGTRLQGRERTLHKLRWRWEKLCQGQRRPLVHRRQNVDPSTTHLTHSAHADVHGRYASTNKHNRLPYNTLVVKTHMFKSRNEKHNPITDWLMWENDDLIIMIKI